MIDFVCALNAKYMLIFLPAAGFLACACIVDGNEILTDAYNTVTTFGDRSRHAVIPDVWYLVQGTASPPNGSMFTTPCSYAACPSPGDSPSVHQSLESWKSRKCRGHLLHIWILVKTICCYIPSLTFCVVQLCRFFCFHPEKNKSMVFCNLKQCFFNST